MLTFLVCLLPVVASVTEPTSENYILDIDKNTLKNIRFINNSHPVLNLSGRNLQEIEKNAFDNLLDLKSLDLSNNSLTLLPEFIFSNLTKLKSLSLANNRIWNLQYLFFGLWNLQLLDISRNPINHLIKGSLFGLPKSARILTDGNDFWSISTDVSSNLFIKDEELAGITTQANTVNENETKIGIIGDMESQNAKSCKALHKNTRLKLCKSDGFVMTLDILWKEEELTERCVQVPINVSRKQVDLHDQNITVFRECWYRLYSLAINSLDLSNNKIAEIMKNTLNNLPEDLTHINFQNNQIRKIRCQVIETDHLKELNFKNNLVEEIEDNAFAKTRLHNLNLNRNQLKSLNFVSSLPDTMIKLKVSGNRITSIPNNALSRFSHLSYLDLQENKIETLQNDVFQNLTSLRTLILARNDITTIEPASFKGLTALKTLDLSRNNIVKISFTDLPRTLNALHLSFNKIGVLEKDNFVKVPRITLTLTGNNISSIAHGAFNLPSLRELYLNLNRLTTIEGDSYEGLARLKSLLLSDNQISEIRKGSCKNLVNLYRLDISSNPFQKLEAGALYGFSTDAGRDLYIYNNNLKEMQASLFDDI